jgi:hypothetical protein
MLTDLILEMLQSHSVLTASEVSQELEIALTIAHRELRILVEQGILVRQPLQLSPKERIIFRFWRRGSLEPAPLAFAHLVPTVKILTSLQERSRVSASELLPLLGDVRVQALFYRLADLKALRLVEQETSKGRDIRYFWHSKWFEDDNELAVAGKVFKTPAVYLRFLRLLHRYEIRRKVLSKLELCQELDVHIDHINHYGRTLEKQGLIECVWIKEALIASGATGYRLAKILRE